MDTGFARQDAQDDFRRARRRASMATVARRLRGRPGEFDVVLPFEEVVEALGRRGERSLGLCTVSLDSIVGSVDRAREFDRTFRPRSGRVRHRWERLAEAVRRGQPIPPIKAYRIGSLHFVEDGHHRVSVLRALGRDEIDAYVTEVLTDVEPGEGLRLSDLPTRSHRRVFLDRVPLPPEAREAVVLSDPWRYPELAEGVEAWGFRAIQDSGRTMDREAVARGWHEEEFGPAVKALREAGLVRSHETDADAYMRLASERYRLLRTHEWDSGVMETLGGEGE